MVSPQKGGIPSKKWYPLGKVVSPRKSGIPLENWHPLGKFLTPQKNETLLENWLPPPWADLETFNTTSLPHIFDGYTLKIGYGHPERRDEHPHGPLQFSYTYKQIDCCVKGLPVYGLLCLGFVVSRVQYSTIMS